MYIFNPVENNRGEDSGDELQFHRKVASTGIAMNGNRCVFLIVDANRCGANMEYEVFCIFAGLNAFQRNVINDSSANL